MAESKWYINKIKGENFIYHCFTFDPKIQEHTFLGNEFIGMDQADEVDVINTFERIVDAGPDGFMPRLVEELQNIFGEGNYVYDGYEIGEDDSGIFEFNLYFLIKESLYVSLLKKVELWSEFNGFEDLISWDTKLLSDE
jgi:hypothetical protein